MADGITPTPATLPRPAAHRRRTAGMPIARLAKNSQGGILPTTMSEHLPTVPHKRNIEYFKKLLAGNPALRRPDVLPELAWSMSEQSWEWKSALRSYDAARIEMKIRTPHEVQLENSWLPPNCTPRLIRRHAAQT